MISGYFIIYNFYCILKMMIAILKSTPTYLYKHGK